MKRAVDIGVALVLLIVTLPLTAVAALAIRLDSSGPVFFRGIRVGRFGRQFRMWKFRTMVVDADRLGSSSTPTDDSRISRAGRWLRRCKLDELPQLINVLAGDMSLVGPRPQVPWAVQRYTVAEKILLTVRPGITDPASIRFANEGEILRGHPDPDRAYLELIHPEKMRLSINYVKNRSFIKDLKILVATVGAALGRRSGRRIVESKTFQPHDTALDRSGRTTGTRSCANVPEQP